MPNEMRIPINAKIPKPLHDSLLAAVEVEKYKDKTACITEALEKLLNNKQEETQDNITFLHDKENEIQKLQYEIQEKNTIIQRIESELQSYKNVIQSKDGEICRLQSVIQKAPGPAELSILQAKYEEIEKHNQTLARELDKASQDKEDLKQTYNNYFLQVQTLITQKAIKAPGNKKPWYQFW